uniref:Uncharacterized protein n=1 Tax=Anguilla anguilla TaxID=7936 RepID=A0A0E9PTT9_ANGAN
MVQFNLTVMHQRTPPSPLEISAKFSTHTKK